MTYGSGGIGKGLVGGAGGGIIILPGAAQTLNALDIAGLAGNTLATWHSFTFVVSEGTIDIDGVTFPPGSYSGGNGSGLMNATSYNAGASTNAQLLIQI